MHILLQWLFLGANISNITNAGIWAIFFHIALGGKAVYISVLICFNVTFTFPRHLCPLLPLLGAVGEFGWDVQSGYVFAWQRPLDVDG